MALEIEVDAAVNLTNKVDELNKRLAQQERKTPRYIEYAFSIVVANAANHAYATDIGGPNQGRHWFVSRVVAHNGYATPPANPIQFFALGSAGAAITGTSLNWAFNGASQQVSAIQLEWISTTLPTAESWGREQFVVHYPNHLYAVVFQPATATSQNVYGVVQAIDLAETEDPRYVMNLPYPT